MSQWDLFLSDQNWVRYQQGRLTAVEDPFQAWGIILVLGTYNPVRHARTLADHGRPDLALTQLKDIPESLISSEASQALLAVEKQRLYLKWQQQLHGQVPSHAFFSKERREFAQAIALSPLLIESYHIHSQFWSYIGRDDRPPERPHEPSPVPAIPGRRHWRAPSDLALSLSKGPPRHCPRPPSPRGARASR
jgi:hypothetical protein